MKSFLAKIKNFVTLFVTLDVFLFVFFWGLFNVLYAQVAIAPLKPEMAQSSDVSSPEKEKLEEKYGLEKILKETYEIFVAAALAEGKNLLTMTKADFDKFIRENIKQSMINAFGAAGLLSPVINNVTDDENNKQVIIDYIWKNMEKMRKENVACGI